MLLAYLANKFFGHCQYFKLISKRYVILCHFIGKIMPLVG